MKRLSIIAICIATLAFASCGLTNAASGSVAQTLGQTCGTAMVGLFQSYRNTGTIDLTTGNNLSNALAIATVYTQLRQHKDDKDYRKAFTNGLILSSAGLITNQNAGNFVNTLLSSSSLGNVNSSSTTSQVNATTPAFTNLVRTLE